MAVHGPGAIPDVRRPMRTYCLSMDDGARAMAVDHLVRDSAAVADTIEIVRSRQVGDWLTVLARWADEQSGRFRRGSVDILLEEGVWHPRFGWSSNADHDHVHPIWRAWGSSRKSTSGWVSDPAAATVRFRDQHGRVEADTVQSGVAILIYDAAFGRGSTVEVLDRDGRVLHAAPL
jgi:hypothetical protein